MICSVMISGLRLELDLRDANIKMSAPKNKKFSVKARDYILACKNSGVKYLAVDLAVIPPSVD